MTADKLTVSCSEDDYEIIPKKIELKRGDRFCVYTYGKDYSNYVAKRQLESNMLVIDGRVVGYDTPVLYDVGEKDIRQLSKGDLRDVKKKSTVSRREYRALLARVAPLKMQARWHLMWCSVALLITAVAFYAVYRKKRNSVMAKVVSGVAMLLLIGLPYLYFRIDPTDSLWFILDAGGFGWLGLLVLVLYLAVYPVALLELFKIAKTNPIALICFLAAAVLFVLLVWTFLVHFWDQGRHLILSVGILIFMDLCAIPAVLDGSLFSSGTSGASDSSSDSGPDQFGYDGSIAYKLKKTGGGYAHDDSGRRWKSDGGSKWHLDE